MDQDRDRRLIRRCIILALLAGAAALPGSAAVGGAVAVASGKSGLTLFPVQCAW